MTSSRNQQTDLLQVSPDLIFSRVKSPDVNEQARDTAKAALKILTVIARPSVKAAGVLQKTLIITENSHIGAQVPGEFIAT